jgi:lipoprotein-anchoring transpeptidase ErfK/SrfK
MTDTKLSRRLLIGAGLAAAALPASAETFQNSTRFEQPTSPKNPRSNVSSFVLRDWRDHFANTKGGAILCDLQSRALHYWSEDQSIYKLYPTSVPLNEELTKRGATTVIDKVVNPRWTATAAMLKRNPDWPKTVEGGSPDNPLGVRALYLGWPTYRIHGTHDTRKIGRQSSNGCVGLYNEHILELFDLVKVGTQVILL